MCAVMRGLTVRVTVLSHVQVQDEEADPHLLRMVKDWTGY